MVAEQCCTRLMGVGDRRTAGSSEEADTGDEVAGGLVDVPEMCLEVAIRLFDCGSVVQDLADKIDEKFIDKDADVTVMLQKQEPVINEMRKTVEVPQVQYVDEIINEPLVAQRQVPTLQAVENTEAVPQAQFLDRVMGVPVATRAQVRFFTRPLMCQL